MFEYNLRKCDFELNSFTAGQMKMALYRKVTNNSFYATRPEEP